MYEDMPGGYPGYETDDDDELDLPAQNPARRRMPGDMRFNRQHRLASQYKFRGYFDIAEKIAVHDVSTLKRALGVYNKNVRRLDSQKLNAARIESLKKDLKAIRDCTTSFLKNEHEKGTAFYSAIKKIDQIASAEYRLYEKYNINMGSLPLSDFLQDAKGKSLTLPNNFGNVSRAGGAMSSRMLLKFNENGQVRKGLFTERTEVDYENTFQHKLQEWNKAFDAQLQSEKDMLNRISPYKKKPKMQEKIVQEMYDENRRVKEGKRFFDVMENARKSYDPSMPASEFYYSVFGIGDNGNLEISPRAPKQIREFVKENQNNPHFKNFYNGVFCDDIQSGRLKYHQYGNIHHLKVGDRIDSRNSAMYSVASLFGQNDLLAKSESMNVKFPSGRVVKGTFMDFADGVDLKHPSADDPYLKAQGEEIITSGKGLKSVADLGVLDYICGNTDRHTRNMIYRFDDNGNFTGVVGIDNDMSFGKTQDGLRVNGGDAADLQVISSGMANAIKATSPDVLRFTLSGYGLSEQDVDCAVERMMTVKKMLDNNTEKGPKIRIVQDNEWDDIKLEDLEKDMFEEPGANRLGKKVKGKGLKVRSIFHSVSLANDSMKQRRMFARDPEEIEEVQPEALGEKFTDATLGTDAATEDYVALSHKMGKLLDNLKEANKGFFVGSKEYDNMLSYATYMNEELQKMAADRELDYKACVRDQRELLMRDREETDPDKILTDEQINARAAENADRIIRNKEKTYFDRAQSMFGAMRDITGMYIRHRNADNKLKTSETARTRTLAATDLYSFVNRNCENFNVTPEELYRQGMAAERQTLIENKYAKDIAKTAPDKLGVKGDEIYNPELEEEKNAAFGKMSAKGIRDQIKALRSIKDPEQRAAREKQFRQYLNERKEEAIRSHLTDEAAKYEKQQAINSKLRRQGKLVEEPVDKRGDDRKKEKKSRSRDMTI